MRFCLNRDGTHPVELGPHMVAILEYPQSARRRIFMMSFALAGELTRVYCIPDPPEDRPGQVMQPRDKIILEPKVPHVRIAKGCIKQFLAEHSFMLGQRLSKGAHSRVYPIEPLS